jgi:hypothetical protein
LEATKAGKERQTAAQGESQIVLFLLDATRDPARHSKVEQTAANAVCSAC